MPAGERRRPQPQPGQHDVAQRSREVAGLSRRYGGIGNIPEDELARLRYARHVGEDGTVTVLPIGSPKKERKVKIPPFETLTVSFPGTDERYRELRDPEITSLLSRVDSLYEHNLDRESSFDGYDEVLPALYEHYIPTDNPLHEFRRQFSRFVMSDLHLSDEILGDIFFSSTAVSEINRRLLEDARSSNIDDLIESLKSTHDDVDIDFGNDDTVITANKTQQLSEYLERKQAKLADLIGLSSFHDVPLSLGREEIESLREAGQPLYADYEYLIENGLVDGQTYSSTTFSITRHFFSKFLEAKGLTGLAEALGASETPETMQALLSEAAQSKEGVKQLKIREAELKEQLRGLAPSEDPSERNALTAMIKQVQSQIKQAGKLLDGMAAFFNIPALATESIKRRINEAQKLLTYPEDQATREFPLLLDARPNPKLDRNPGEISGDCTEGRPLPFEESFIPLFNVKVFREKRHIGNIYLLETQTTDGQTAWHLEAIQIPIRGVQWNSAIESLVSSLASKAQEKNVAMITVNDDQFDRESYPLISNYDYIGIAAHNYWENHSGAKTTVRVPANPDTGKYSDFQGDGDALILWQAQTPSGQV